MVLPDAIQRPPGQIGSFAHKKVFGTLTLDATDKFYDPDDDDLTYNWLYMLRGVSGIGTSTAAGISVTLPDLLPGFYDRLWLL